MARREFKKPRIKIEDLDTAAATDAKNHFGELLHRVVYSRIPVLVERHGQPVAVLVDIDQYLELVKNPPLRRQKNHLGGAGLEHPDNDFYDDGADQRREQRGGRH